MWQNDFEPLLLVSKEPVSHTEKKKEMPSQVLCFVSFSLGREEN